VDDLSIRTARLTDLPELTEIFRLASLSNDGDRQHLLDNPQYLELSDESIRSGRMRLAETAARPVGFATVVGDAPVVELEDLFVHPDWMRRGIATRLIADAVEQSRLRGATRIEVTANPHANAFYEHVGFRATASVDTTFGPGTRMELPIPVAD
jgi:GNAT superfamily N-acetyltransferase